MRKMKMVPTGAAKNVCLTGRTSSGLALSAVCLRFLLGMAMLAIPMQAQTNAYVADSGSNLVSVIDTTANNVVATVGVGDAPQGVAITPDGTRVYVTNSNDSTVSVISTASKTVVATVEVGTSPARVALARRPSRSPVTGGLTRT